ncbi:MAG: hypothetical protein EA403_08010 [Spirochaetaceae bacterium]|nr:MAG: hypothetical protein EA403_08010 [Spirochaetaceae bacterium]
MSVLVVDFGTSSCRAATVDRNGIVTSVSRIEHPPGQRGVTLDVETAWNTLCSAIRTERHGSDLAIEAIAVAGLLAWVFLDGHGDPLGPALTYADARGGAEAHAGEIADTEGDNAGETRLRLSGRRARADLAAWKLVWMRAHQPEIFSRVAAVHGLKDEFVRRLTGERVTDLAHADYTHCFSPGDRRFSDELCERAGLSPRLFAPVVAAQQVVGRLRRDGAAAAGVPEGTPVVAGSSDGTTAMYGCGVLSGELVAVCGTTDVLMQHLTQLPSEPSRALTVNSAMAGSGFLVGGATGSSGGMLAAVAALTGLELGECDAAAAQVQPGCEGLIAVPSLTGERAPYWHDSLRGGFIGLTEAHTREHLVRAVMEACAYRWRRLVSLLDDAGGGSRSIAVSGGGSTSTIWNQIRSDVVQRAVVRRCEPESTILGAAMFARAGVDPSVTLPELGRRWISDAETWTPRGETASVYADAFARFERIISSGAQEAVWQATSTLSE